MKKYFYWIGTLLILIVGSNLLSSTMRYWIGNNNPCYSENQCECGAKGFVGVESLGFIKIPYYFSCEPTRLRIANEKEQIRKDIEERKKRQEKRFQELSNSCDMGWIFVNNHCERCDSSETFKVSESDCLKCNQYEELRVYDSQSAECKLKN